MLYRLSIEFAIDLNSASSAISKHLSKHLSKHSKTIRTEVTGAMEIKQELEGGLLVRERTFEVFDEHLITFCLFKMPGRTFLLWIGNQCEQKRQQLSNLCLAINGSATTIVGNEANSVAVRARCAAESDMPPLCRPAAAAGEADVGSVADLQAGRVPGVPHSADPVAKMGAGEPVTRTYAGDRLSSAHICRGPP